MPRSAPNSASSRSCRRDSESWREVVDIDTWGDNAWPVIDSESWSASLAKMSPTLAARVSAATVGTRLVLGVDVVISEKDWKLKISAPAAAEAARFALRDCRFFFSPGLRGLYL